MTKEQAIANYMAAAAAAMEETLRLGRFDKNGPAAKAEVKAAKILRRASR